MQNIFCQIGLSIGLILICVNVQAQESPNRWVGTWATAPVAVPLATTQPVGDLTYREIIHVSQGAQRVRLIFSNEFGTTPLTISAVHIAPSAGQSRIDQNQDRLVTFSGQPVVQIPPGARYLSDAVSLSVGPLSTWAVSFYVPSQSLRVLSIHQLAIQTNYVAKGDQVTAASLPEAKEITTYPFLRTAEIEPNVQVDAIVCLGDSITDGKHSTIDVNKRWPNTLANRLVQQEGAGAPSVLDLGIGGNRLLQDGVGPNALARLDRDVLSQSRAGYLILLEGINDLGDGFAQGQGNESPSASDIEAAYTQIIKRAHAHNLRVYGATLLPYEGATYFSEQGEVVREELNRWIRTEKEFDAVLDFDLVVRDPQHPKRLLPAYNSGDNLHPNDAGYDAIGESIPLWLFRKDARH